jgi:hypothetical protein
VRIRKSRRKNTPKNQQLTLYLKIPLVNVPDPKERPSGAFGVEPGAGCGKKVEGIYRRLGSESADFSAITTRSVQGFFAGSG